MSVVTDLMVSNTIRDYGDQALLLECESADEVLALTSALHRDPIPGVLDVVPGARTVLVKLAGSHVQATVRQRLTALAGEYSADATGHRTEVVIDVVYDGADLPDVARHTGLDVAAVVEAHTATAWRVGFGGFAPGFAYLIDGDPRLRVPRRSDPRTRVPAGSVGLAGEFSGIYPRQSPGGWQLIGRTDAVLWDIDRPAPALLLPGMWVRFRAV
ncbi:allophanate hydrolase subunit 1 [Mycobacterium sp. M26]|uniref:5-oxoprolinase subunit B family protein n=1 Tax=Mycobacterium sp. M26 TaxID=1762962 RepID=UPI00073EA73D|nr:allophanate hydrolase subunit 1 [Mycobacterium sp. M26]